MLFKLALFSSILFLSLVMADPSSRNHARTANLTNDRTYSTNWAGAVCSKPNGTFTSVTGTVTVPTTPSGDPGSAASIWVGIDGQSCANVAFQTGIDFVLSDGNGSYNVWYEWYPAPVGNLPNLSISPGDVIRLTINLFSVMSGTASVENLTNGQSVIKSINSTTALCGQNAGWVLGSFSQDGYSLPLANFTTVTFTNAEASGPDKVYTPMDATIVDIRQKNTTLTLTTTDELSVTIDSSYWFHVV